jgi:hypothetical protein
MTQLQLSSLEAFMDLSGHPTTPTKKVKKPDVLGRQSYVSVVLSVIVTYLVQFRMRD